MQTQNQIPLVNLKRQVSRLRSEFVADFNMLLEQADFIGGASITVFERAFADYCQATYCVGVGNGTDALALIFKALDFQPGDEVITTPMSFVSTVESLSTMSLGIVFADIDPQTYTLDPERVRPLITEKTKAILPMHLYGQPADLSGLQKLADEFGLYLIEDASHAPGAEFEGRRIGSLSKAAAFSFYPDKNLGAFGDAGCVITQDEALAEKIRMIANHGRIAKYEYQLAGVNSRLDTLHASVLLTKLRHLDAGNQRRQELALFYNRLLADIPEITLPMVALNRTHVYYLYVIQTTRRDDLLAYLQAQGIQATIHYPIPLHLQPAFAYLSYPDGAFPHAEKLSRQCLSLPLCPDLTEVEAEVVAEAVRGFFRQVD